MVYAKIFILIFAQMAFSQEKDSSLNIKPDYGFPKWLESGEYFTQQTSGIAFIKKEGNSRHFLLADDIGALHRLIITDDTLFRFIDVKLSPEVKDFLSVFPKKDFEEILYDRTSGRVYLSIEGNKPVTKNTVGIYEITFAGDNKLGDSVVSIQKLKINPEKEFLRYTDDNIGFEGICSDENYFYFALEGFSFGGLFADSTLIYIADKKNLILKKIISTKKLGIGTICGLYSDSSRSVYGVDRNSRNLFHIIFSRDLEIEKVSLRKIPAAIPNYNSFDYVVSFESLTMDDEQNLYLVDDPWKSFYIPPDTVLSRLDDKTVRNFRSYIPAIYKFTLYH